MKRYWMVGRWMCRCEARIHSSVGATGAVYAIRRSLWIPLPAGLLLDDVYSPMQIVLQGRRIGFADDAVAVEMRTPDAGQEYRRTWKTHWKTHIGFAIATGVYTIYAKSTGRIVADGRLTAGEMYDSDDPRLFTRT